jgi:small GTP-binding protein
LKYYASVDGYYRNAQGFLLLYSITSRQSFEGIGFLREKMIQLHESDAVPIILVGNKCDLVEHREVSAEEGMEIANGWGVPFYETSACTGVNVKEVFSEIVREIRKKAFVPGRERRGRAACSCL